MFEKKFETPEQVEEEIARLRNSPYVKLVDMYNKRRQCMYNLRWKEKQGIMLAEKGFTIEQLEEGLNEERLEQIRE